MDANPHSPKELFSIGTVAKSFGVSENTIRRMETADLLEPAFISPKNGYRYYDLDNLFRIEIILNLRAFGFVYEDMWEHLQHPGDYSLLYEKMREKQRELEQMVENLRMHMRLRPDIRQCEILNYKTTWVFTRETQMQPTWANLSNMIHRTLCDAVQQKLPVDYTRSVLIITDRSDFSNYRWEAEQNLTICIPLRHPIDGDDIRFMPGTKAASFLLSGKRNTSEYISAALNDLISSHHLKQIDTIRVTFDIGSYMGNGITEEDTIIHILIPVA